MGALSSVARVSTAVKKNTSIPSHEPPRCLQTWRSKREDCQCRESAERRFGLIALPFMVVATAGQCQEKIRWKMPSAFAATTPHLVLSRCASPRYRRMSEGKSRSNFFEPGAIVPALEASRCGLQGSAEGAGRAGAYTPASIQRSPSHAVPFGPGFGGIPGVGSGSWRQ